MDRDHSRDLAVLLRNMRFTCLSAQFWRLAGRMGKKKAAMAVAQSILVIAYHIMASDDEVYRDLVADWFTRRNDPDAHRDRLVRTLTDLGYHVELTPAAA